MKFAIIAAGEGSRLRHEGVCVPKPLVALRGETLIGRLIRIFEENEAEEIVVIVNDLYPETAKYLESLKNEDRAGNLKITVKTTPSSMHSFYEISRFLSDSDFCLTTVDTIFDESEFRRFVNLFKHYQTDGLMAVTDYIDDEKPLYVATDGRMHITAFNDANVGDKFISGGIYCLKPNSINILEECIKKGMSRMRNFQRALIAGGLDLEAYCFSKILDIDHAGDIVKAEEFLKECCND